VVCQKYINASYRASGLKRSEAIARGPMYSSDSYVKVVDAAANYWKHHGEWDGEGEPERRTRAVLDALFPSGSDYPMSNILHELLGRPATLRLSDLVPWLESWR
jgi:hypothetical protein